MRAYDVAATALTLQATAKWVDNTLSQHQVAGVTRERQGVSRRLTPRAILTLEIALRLIKAAHIPLASALALAERATYSGLQVSSVDLAESICLKIDIAAIEHEIEARLSRAVELAPSPRRGRPRGSRK
ncbi:MAG: hypothetical protein ABIS03_02220 [Gemmatimonadaceae bacterium]